VARGQQKILPSESLYQIWCLHRVSRPDDRSIGKNGRPDSVHGDSSAQAKNCINRGFQYSVNLQAS
jgi:hypothetical protein